MFTFEPVFVDLTFDEDDVASSETELPGTQQLRLAFSFGSWAGGVGKLLRLRANQCVPTHRERNFNIRNRQKLRENNA